MKIKKLIGIAKSIPISKKSAPRYLPNYEVVSINQLKLGINKNVILSGKIVNYPSKEGDVPM